MPGQWLVFSILATSLLQTVIIHMKIPYKGTLGLPESS